MKLITTGHGVYRIEYHVVWVTKYRRKILNPGVQMYLRKLFSKIVKETPGVVIHELGMEEDHLHLLITIPPKYSVSSIIAKLKSKTSSTLRKKFTWLKKVYWKENIVWSPGFFVSTVGVNEKVIRKYVKYQGKQDSNQIQLEFV